MIVAAWTNFLGANTRISAKRLGEGIGVVAINIRPGSADLRGWGAANTVVTTGGSTPLISAYRMGRSTISDVADWLQWTTDVDVCRSLIGNDTSEEIYYTGNGYPKRTDNIIGLPGAPGPAASRYLGIRKPQTAMTAVVLVAGAGATSTRVYIDTYVNNQGRESAPGLPVVLVCLGGSTATLGSLDTASTSGYVDITLRRIYCSTDGGAYLRLAELAVATTTTTDALARSAVLSTGGDATKPAHEMPPATWKGLIHLWAGMIGGFDGKNYGVCEPNKPWAWPVEYQSPVLDDIVGTGKWLTNWLLLTNSQPYLVNGTSPLALSDSPTEFMQSCISKRSIASMGHGVCWASPNGLCYMGQGGAKLVTEGIFTPEQWAALAPSTMIGTRYENFYLGFYNDGSGLKGLLIDPLNPTGFIGLTQGAQGRFMDPVSERLYLQDTGNVIRRWNGGSALSVTFKTGVRRAPHLTNPAYGLVIGDTPISVAMTLYANALQTDGTHAWTAVFTGTVTAGVAFALPGGYMAQEFQAQLVTTGPIQGLIVVEEPDDLP